MNTQQEHDIYRFFEGLDAGLKSLSQVRTLYDEQVAFEFNSTHFFHPNENKTSEILAFFLNPKKNHGQKATFLNLFSKKHAPKAPRLLSQDLEAIRVETEYHTDENRRIDITIHFGYNDYVIGIENKIGTAADQPNQLTDYANELRMLTKHKDENWILFYLTPHKSEPSIPSMTKEEQERLINSGNLQLISYSKDIIELIEQFEMACKAENVRAFLKDFKQYLKQKHIGETIMGETELTESFIKDNPKILLHIDNVCRAISNLYQNFRDDFLVELCKELKAEGLDLIDPSRWDKGWEPNAARYFHVRFDQKHDINIDERPLGFRLMWTGHTNPPRLLIGLGPEHKCNFEIDLQTLESLKKSIDVQYHDDIVDIGGDNLSLGWVILVDSFMSKEYMTGKCKRPMKEIVDPIVIKIKEYMSFCNRLLKGDL